MEKVCTKCKTIKDFSCFSKGLDTNHLHYWCKKCCSSYAKDRRINNTEVIKEYEKKYRETNRELINKKAKDKYYSDPTVKILNRLRNRDNYHKLKNNPEWLEKRKKYLIEYRRRPEVMAKTNKRFKERYHSEPAFRMRDNLSGRMNHLLKGRSKSASTMKLIGCTLDKLKKYIESQFEEGMTWDNHNKNGWHIDHIVPCNQFNLDNPEEQKKCFNYTNLRPLWAEENLSTQWR